MFSVSLRLNSTEEERTVLQASKQQQNLCSSFYNVLEGNTIEFRLKSYLYEKKHFFRSQSTFSIYILGHLIFISLFF